jgi:hypothetical protein
MSVTPLPALDRTDPDFRTDVDTFFGTELPTFSVEVEALRVEVLASEANAITQADTATTQAGISTTQADISTDQAVISTTQADISTTQAGLAATSAASALNAPGTSATSTTSLTIGSGAQSLTIQTGKLFTVGQTAVIARTSDPVDQMTGVITAHNSGTGALSVIIPTNGFDGSGTFTDWTISLSGAKGIPGPAALSAGVPIGGLVAKKESGSSFVDGDATWLRTGTLEVTATYPLAPTTTISDAATWTTKTATSMAAPVMAANGTGTIICTSSSASVASYDISTDNGDTWSSVALPKTMYCFPVWCGTFFLLIETTVASTTFYTSTTGATGSWTTRTVTSNTYFSGVYGDAGCIITSATTDTLITKNGITYAGWAAPVANMAGVFGNGFYLFYRWGFSSSIIYKTYTGESNSYQSINSPTAINDVTAGLSPISYGNGVFMFLKYGGTNVIGFYTQDAFTFSYLITSIPIVNSPINLTYGNGAFLATRYNNSTNLGYVSKDNGITWSSVTLPASTIVRNQIFSNGAFLSKVQSSTSVYKSVTSATFTDTSRALFADGIEKQRPYYMRVV